MQRVGIIVHRAKREAWEFAAEVIAWLNARDVSVALDTESASRLERPDLACCESEWASVDFVVSLGGDGTILTAAHMAAPNGIPILGVHMGRFGFMAATVPDDLYGCLERILGGVMEVEERLMVQVEVWRGTERAYHEVGLNEILIRGTHSNLLNFQTFLRDAPFAEFPADGVIVATPTGSTGYSLSAGGPIVGPTVQALVITALCPHTLSARPLLVPSDELIQVQVDADGGNALCLVDNINPFTLYDGDRILIRRADYNTRLIVLDHKAFYRKVRDRYRYGERLNQ